MNVFKKIKDKITKSESEQPSRLPSTDFISPFDDANPISSKQGKSYLKNETTKMDRQRRILEQTGHRQLARVKAREHADPDLTAAAPSQGEEFENGMMQHPFLNTQRFDGIDSNVNPAPPLNTDARREYDNQRREQELEKQLRLGNMPAFKTAPEPLKP